MDEQTLAGKKMEVYVLLKILKYCTDSPAKSYQLKFAVNQVFQNKSIQDIQEVGAAVKKTINYKRLDNHYNLHEYRRNRDYGSYGPAETTAVPGSFP